MPKKQVSGVLAGVALLLALAEAVLPRGSLSGRSPARQAVEPEGRPPGQLPNDHKGLQDLEQQIRRAVEKVRPAAVRLARPRGGAPAGSGVIVTPEGLVLTHGHHGLGPPESVRVILAGGREVEGTVLATIQTSQGEGSTVRITARGTYPHADLGRPDLVRLGDWCLALGHPGGAQKGPALRLGQISTHQPSRNHLLTTCITNRGDSGGPLFDLDGRVLGILGGRVVEGGESDRRPLRAESIAVGVDWFRARWQDLTGTIPAGAVKDWSPPTAGFRVEVSRAAALGEVTARARRATVRVLCDGSPQALGTVVGADGWVLTKASAVYGKVACVWESSRRLPAEVIGVSRPHDLALLRVRAGDLPAVEWAGPRDPGLGQLVSSPSPGEVPLRVGVVSSGRQPVPPEPGHIGLETADAKGGVRVVAFPAFNLARSVAGLAVGDLVTHVDGKPVLTRERFAELTGGGQRWAGDRVRLTLRRGGRRLEVSVPYSPQSPGRHEDEEGLSYRAGGFAAVLGHDTVLGCGECGGPLVDLLGQAVGVNVARAGQEVTYAVPSQVVLGLLEDLKSGRRKPEAGER